MPKNTCKFRDEFFEQWTFVKKRMPELIDAPYSEIPNGELQGSVGSQFKALLNRNFTLKKRELQKTMTELLMPIYFIVLLAIVRMSTNDQTYPAITNPHGGAALPRASEVLDRNYFYVAPNTSEVQALIEKIEEESTASLNVTYFNNEEDLLDYHSHGGNVTIALIFSSNPIADPKYKIRYNRDLYFLPDSVDAIANGIQCRKMMMDWALEGSSTCSANSYFHSGFLSLQLAIESAIISMNTSRNIPSIKYYLQSFPVNEYISTGTTKLRNIVPLYMVFAWAQFIIYLMILIVEEKEKKIKEGMKMMGLRMSVYWLSWVTIYFGYVIILALGCIIILPTARVFKHANMFLLFILFVLYGLSSIVLALLLTPFFNKARMAGIVGQTSQIVMSLLFYLQVYLADKISTGMFYVLALLSPCAFSMAIDKVLLFDFSKGGLTWNNIWEGDGLPFAGSLIMISVDIILYFSLAFYFDNVIPSEYGTKQKPWFIFQYSYWFGYTRDSAEVCTKSKITPGSCDNRASEEEDADSVGNNADIEPISTELRGKEAIRMKNLTKVFKTIGHEEVRAVDGITLDIYEGQVTAILGHNGAGKTTLFNILTGMVAPTGGSAFIFGYNIKDQTDLDCIRRMTGICPQHDILFNKLTPREHLSFFAKIRGLPAQDTAKAVNDMLRDIDLHLKADFYAGDLSGGQKRKLSIGIAFIGDPKLVFLDEPTAGVDAYSRRHLWHLIKRKKPGKVILLTTHFMDEADILSDRKAVVSKGKLRCCGTSIFLKNRFGVGYNLTIVTSENARAEDVRTVVRRVVPDAELARFYGKEASFILPMASTDLFSQLFEDLDLNISSESDPLKKIETYGISMTTLEEVFLTLSQEEEREDSTAVTNLARNFVKRRISSDGIKKDCEPSNRGFTFETMQLEKSNLRSFTALCKLRLINLIREVSAIFYLIVVPLIFLAGGIALANTFSFSTPEDQPVVFKPDLYLTEANVSLLKNRTSASDLSSIEGVLKNKGLRVKPFFSDNYTFLYINQPFFAAFNVRGYDTSSVDVILQYNTSFIHTLPILINLMSNSIWRQLSSSVSGFIEVTSEHLPRLESQSVAFNFGAYFAPVLIGMTFTLIPSTLVMDIVYDREIKGRNILRLNGVGFNQYFCSFFAVIGSLYFISYIGLLVIIQAFQVPSLVEPHAFATIAILFFIYMPGTLLSTSCYSYMFDKQETARQFYPSIASMIGILFYTCVSTVDTLVGNGSDFATPIHCICALFVPFYIPYGLLYYITKIYFSCSFANSCDVLGWSDYMTVEIVFIYIGCVLNVFLYYFLLRVVDLIKLGGNFRDAFWMSPKLVDWEHLDASQGALANEDEDEDVQRERRRVFHSIGNSERDSPALIYDVGKTFPLEKKLFRKPSSEFVAVKTVSLEVRAGEVFGLLGPNGAGKTTTLRMMTAEEAPSRGKIQLCGYDIRSSMSEAFTNLGYCPQHDCLWPNLTVEEHIECFAEIGGVPKNDVKSLIQLYLNGLEINEHKDKKSKTCSGGTKRKLSYILSMMGRPKIVLLDEPSTGMDPQSKRFLWDSILSSFKGDFSSVLTTHSMEEADALCARIGILVKGELRCLGSVQHLKNKYGGGYSLEIKLQKSRRGDHSGSLRGDSSETADGSSNGSYSMVEIARDSGDAPGDLSGDASGDRVKKLLLETFCHSRIDEEFEERIVFKIPPEDVANLGGIFTLMEEAKRSGLVSEYALSQTSLEQVFLRFARQQEEEEEKGALRATV